MFGIIGRFGIAVGLSIVGDGSVRKVSRGAAGVKRAVSCAAIEIVRNIGKKVGTRQILAAADGVSSARNVVIWDSVTLTRISTCVP